MALLWPGSLLGLLATCLGVHAAVQADSSNIRKIPVSLYICYQGLTDLGYQQLRSQSLSAVSGVLSNQSQAADGLDVAILGFRHAKSLLRLWRRHNNTGRSVRISGAPLYAVAAA